MIPFTKSRKAHNEGDTSEGPLPPLMAGLALLEADQISFLENKIIK